VRGPVRTALVAVMPAAATVLVACERDDLRAAVGRLVTAAGLAATMPVAAGRAALLSPAAWRSAAAVIVGPDRLGELAAAALPRRSGVLVAALERLDEAGWRAAVAIGAEAVLTLPADERRLVELLCGAAEPPARQGAVIAVVGGSGGAGASTLAAAVGIAAARAAPALLIDADPYGGGLDVLLAAEDRPGVRWADLASARGRLHPERLGAALVDLDRLRLLSFGRTPLADLPAGAAAAVLSAGRRGFDRTVVDLPRRFDPGSTLLAGSADLVVIVVVNRVRAVAAAAVLARALASAEARLCLAVRISSRGQLSVRDVTGAVSPPAVAVLRDEPAVAAAAEQGRLPIGRSRGSLAQAAEAVLAAATEVPAGATA